GGGVAANNFPSALPGPFAFHKTLHMLSGGTLTVGGAGISLTVDNVGFSASSGDMVMESGSLIDSSVSGSGGVAGPVTIKVGNFPSIPPVGVFTMKTGSKIVGNNNQSGVGADISITAGKSGDIDGQVLSQVTGSSGTGAKQGRDGGSIFVKTGCGLVVSETG